MIVGRRNPGTALRRPVSKLNTSRTGSDWGVPDGMNRQDYKTGRWCKFRWAWEFMRRRQDVREAFERLADPSYKNLEADPEFDGPAPHEPGFWAVNPTRPLFGMNGIPNPRIGDQPFLGGLFEESFGQIVVGTGIDYLSLDSWQRVFIPRGRAAVIIDLSTSFKHQWDEIECRLESMFGKPKRRIHTDKWTRYLRVLDAIEAGFTLSEIEERILTEYNYAPGSQAARDVKEQAENVRDNFPRGYWPINPRDD